MLTPLESFGNPFLSVVAPMPYTDLQALFAPSDVGKHKAECVASSSKSVVVPAFMAPMMKSLMPLVSGEMASAVKSF